MAGLIGALKLDATVHRSRENYAAICVAKLKELPPTLGDWMNVPNAAFRGRTPIAAIEAGDGFSVEAKVEKMIHLHEAFTALTEIYRRYKDVPELEETWAAFVTACPKYEAIIGG